MTRPYRVFHGILAVVVGVTVVLVGTQPATATAGANGPATARVIAVGIPDASTITVVGRFLPGSPIHDNPAFAAYTQPGRVLDPSRILVGSTSNFGAPAANPQWNKGSLLSIDTRGGGVVAVPADFAASGGQASARGGRVQLFTSQSPAFRNGNNNPNARTAAFTGVSNPVGLSINNAFGRIWPANVLRDVRGIGSNTILDPTGIPLAGAPSAVAGGVFAGKLTSRQPTQLIPGALDRGALGTAFLGKSPDGSGRAVFCVVLADGAIVQVHTVEGVDGLAPARTVDPVFGGQGGNGRAVTPRLGVIVNHAPSRILYVSEPFENTVAAIALNDDGKVFVPGPVRRIRSRAFDQPVDLAPATIETAHPNWASNTTLAVGSDFYVANRGNNTITRVRQDGTVVAVRRVSLPGGRSLGPARLNGIAVSADGSTIWVTVTGKLGGRHQHRASGAVLQLPAFGASRDNATARP